MLREQNPQVSRPGALAGLTESQLGDAANDFIERRARGETPTILEYEKKYPEIAGAIRDLFPALDLIGNPASGASAAVDRDAFGQSRRLGDFQIISELGRGGMGVVYEAEQISMGRRVALKVLPLAGLVDELKIRRFHNEVRAVAALDHPNIVSVYMIGEERGVHFFAMQLVRGRSLAQIITSLRQVRDQGEVLNGESVSQTLMVGTPGVGKPDDLPLGQSADALTEVAQTKSDGEATPGHPVTVDQVDDSTIPHTTRREYFRSVAALGIQAATALQHAHDQGVVHRDIKPANLLLDKSSTLFVTDFGLARIEADVGVTMTGDVVGTLRYMAPEQALAKRVAVDHRADIYSLAATLYELLALRPVYLADDRQQLLKQIAFEEPTPLRRIDREIPRELEIIVQKAMAKDMDERYASAQEFADELRRFLDDRPIQAKRPTASQVVTKWTRRNPAITWASIVTLSVVAIAFGVIALLVAKQWDKAVSDSAALREANQETEDQLRIATITRLAAESRALQDERPIQSVLLAVEAVELSQRRDASVLPIAHEALLNATQRLRRGRTLSGHGTKISALTMSSEWLITLGEDKAHLWDLTARRPWSSSRALGEDGDEIKSMALSDDGRRLVTAGSKLQQWDLPARNPELSALDLAAGEIPVTCLSLSPDGRWLATQSEDGTTKFWDLNAANPGASRILSRQTNLRPGVVVSPDGRWVAVAERERPNTALLLELHADGISAPLSLKGHNEPIHDFAVSSNSRWLATASQDKTIRLWDLKAEAPAATSRVIPAGNRMAQGRLVISPDSRWLFAETSYESRILRWDMSAEDPGSSRTVLPHRDVVTSLGVSRDGRWLISSSRDGTARVWPLDAVEPSTGSITIRAHDSLQAAAIHPGGRWMATAGMDGTARLWDLDGSDPASSQFVLRPDDDDVFSATAISSSGRWIATAANASAVQLWDVEAGDPRMYRRVLQGPDAIIRSAEISLNDRWLTTSSMDGTAQLWDLESEDIQSSLKVLGGRGVETEPGIAKPGIVDPDVTAIVGPQSRWLALACADHAVRLWDMTASDTVEPTHVLSGHKSHVKAMAISADDRWLITSAPNGDATDLRLWDIKADDPQSSHRELLVADCDVFAMAINANSRWLATQGPRYTTQLLDLHADDPTTSSRLLPSPAELWGTANAGIWQIAISPDGRWLFTSRFDHTAQLWDLSKETPTPYVLLGHNGVQSAAISRDGHWLVAGCRSQTYLWDLTARDPTSTARVLRGHEEVVWSVRISADSRWLVTDSSDGTIRRWNLDTEWLLDHAREVAGRDLTKDEREHYQIPVVRSGYASDPVGPDRY